MTSKTQSTAKASKPIENAVAAGKQTIEQTIKASTDGYEQAIAMGKEQVETASNATFRGYDEILWLNKQSAEAAMTAGNVWAQGYENLGKAYFGFAQESAEPSAEAAQAMMKAKTLQDVVNKQSDYAKQGFDYFVTEGTKMSGMSAKVATKAMEPLQNQFDSAVSTMTKPIAI